MTDPFIAFGAAFLLGLAGAGHCIGMCGGVVSAAAMSAPASSSRNILYLLFYNLGRILSYGLMGLLLAVGAALTPTTDWPLARSLAALLLVFMGLYFWGWRSGIAQIEVVGRLVWPKIQPLGRLVLPVDKPYKALLLGSIWGWLPCGLVYSALAFAIAQSSVWIAGLTMLAFGLGTFPALLIGGLAASSLKRVLQLSAVGRLLGSFYIAMGLWTLTAAWAHVFLHPPSSTSEHTHHHHH